MLGNEAFVAQEAGTDPVIMFAWQNLLSACTTLLYINVQQPVNSYASEGAGQMQSEFAT